MLQLSTIHKLIHYIVRLPEDKPEGDNFLSFPVQVLQGGKGSLDFEALQDVKLHITTTYNFDIKFTSEDAGESRGGGG